MTNCFIRYNFFYFGLINPQFETGYEKYLYIVVNKQRNRTVPLKQVACSCEDGDETLVARN